MAAVCFRWTQACVEGHIFHLCVESRPWRPHSRRRRARRAREQASRAARSTAACHHRPQPQEARIAPWPYSLRSGAPPPSRRGSRAARRRARGQTCDAPAPCGRTPGRGGACACSSRRAAGRERRDPLPRKRPRRARAGQAVVWGRSPRCADIGARSGRRQARKSAALVGGAGARARAQPRAAQCPSMASRGSPATREAPAASRATAEAPSPPAGSAFGCSPSAT